MKGFMLQTIKGVFFCALALGFGSSDAYSQSSSYGNGPVLMPDVNAPSVQPETPQALPQRILKNIQLSEDEAAKLALLLGRPMYFRSSNETEDDICAGRWSESSFTLVLDQVTEWQCILSVSQEIVECEPGQKPNVTKSILSWGAERCEEFLPVLELVLQ